MPNWIGISLGDPSGIGPEVTLKALARTESDSFKYLLLGDANSLRRLNVNIELPLLPFTDYSADGRFFVLHCGPNLPRPLEPGTPVAAQSAMAALEEAGRRCLRGELAGMVTAPLNKKSVIRLGKPFTGQTEFLSDLAGASRTAMMLLGKDDRERWLRVALVTTHIPLRAVSDALTPAKVQQTIELAAEACNRLKLPRARVAVCGLNPHAGEGGEIGTEEITTIRPAIEAARAKGLDVAGPIPADTLFYYAYNGHYDAVVAMYHDQGLGPLKMIGFESGINWTLGLSFVRTSPDHGTAYDIAGQNKANPSSMLAAINLARTLSSSRK
jgi:4-hydroxythreonine-4-phosphate dehydrogenase